MTDFTQSDAMKSAYFRNLQSLRKTKVLPFTDPEKARAAQLLSAKARRENAQKQKEVIKEVIKETQN